ncbi:trypsin-like serine protease [Streptomyces sp. SL13]|uniref:Trypsin-like serine protease n=1 Tax=Streptantibioticus silvisoli TaxID=2705255 RepID=A0AA90H0B3_9ACTN|nr:trypsin-like peptidase domain-containing protein [Streptantibioticus silvisoli]MDI5963224.1 trypsin-like serine protease [Streptantibioticus silvisoli]MDI5968663.1 trypsin-like serine protease [Streptantibioticus silvisoli]
MSFRPSRYLRAVRTRAVPGRLGRNTVLTVSWLAVLAIGSTASASGLTGGGTALGGSHAVHDTRATSAVGAIFHGTVSSSGDHFCSAGVVDSPQGDMIVTAAHCLSGSTAGLSFVPGYHDGRAPYGVWRLGDVTLDPRWTRDQDPDADVAFATVLPLGGRRLQDVVGGFGLETDHAPSATIRLTGYPSDADAPLTCVNRITAYSATQLRIVCAAYSGGTSGSPWVTRQNTVMGVIGGYEQGGDTPDVSYSAVFGDAVATLYQDAVTQDPANRS